MSRRPRPPMNQDTQFLWDGFEADEFRIQRCMGCQELRHPPGPARPGLPELPQLRVGLRRRQRARHRLQLRELPPQVLPFEKPNPIALIETEEGTRFISNLVEIDPDAIKIGMPVEVVFTQVDDELKLPLFKPSEA
jgi:uncharacterized OB-fold protein